MQKIYTLADSLISHNVLYETMSNNILIEKADEGIDDEGSDNLNDNNSIYSLVDKPYYIDALRYEIAD